jgi:2-C-methyl-D-erythritol 4-phosphate cytidylyltransferase
MKVSSIIAAGGSGSRLGIPGGKQLLELQGKPVLIHSLEKLIQFSDEIVIVLEEKDIPRLKESLKKFKLLDKVKEIVPGGKTRAESVHNAFLKTDPQTDLVLIHDGVRPFVAKKNIENVLSAAEKYGAAVLCTKVKDTIKKETDSFIEHTPERSTLWAAQTPQVIKRTWLAEAYEQLSDWQNVTDDVALVEMLGKKVRIVEGNYNNIKITTKEDLLLAESLLK